MRRLLARAVLVLAALALAVASFSTYRALRQLQENDRAAESALAAARALVPDLLSYDYRTVDRDLARARGRTTGRLTDDYTRLAQTIPPDARHRQTVRQAVVAAAGVESATPEEVRILVFVNTVTSRVEPGSATPRQQVAQGRVRLVLVTDGDGWRASDMSTLLGDTPAR
ncbi:hypothetical protein JOL79_13770 [Microbispora sp. RL4-1S]|uniref:Mce-associated membrane protein n=1 Tax=Microbispora oryzae TaxID=2806554 RepID=A0A940WFW3_9ACTN|nr:hypothetical protein [Microbispora oryzae]MBP2704884.1 hypothetical protein [Microbispora oryzae]